MQRDQLPHLFHPLALRTVEARNRIMVSPMCQYSAEDGLADDWHFQHLAARAVGGAGIVCVEATHVEPRGRITKHCLGLWNDEQRDRLARIARFIALQGAVPAIQIAHAGRKASVSRPWEGTQPLSRDDGAWEAIGPSALAYGNRTTALKAMDDAMIAEVIAEFRHSARRAREAGFKLLEVHAAHGYLINEFLSPLSNARSDRYGGSFENRIRFLLETLDAVRSEWPTDLPLFVRLSVTEWVPGGWDMDDTVKLCRALKQRGDVDLIDCSSGGNSPGQRVPVYPGHQVPFAERIRREADIATAAVGLISAPEAAEEIIANGRADLVAVGRVMLFDPNWPLHAANALKSKTVPWPLQYERASIF
jgi:2,4-dienoyl-CoA reductase-like NADH-dependent reductase (Old Yellow Enzyme family)